MIQNLWSFRDTAVRQVHWMNPTRSTNVRHICITTIPECQISLCFALQPAITEIQAILRQVHWMTPKWPWTLQGKRYPIYVLPVSLSHKFQSVLVHNHPFSIYRTFYNSTLTTMLNGQRKNKKKCKKFKISNFTILLTTLVETLPTGEHDFWGANLVYTFRGDVIWNFPSHMVPC